MRERSSIKKRPGDVNALASWIIGEATGTTVKNPAAVALGRIGGKKGGPARAKKLTPEERSKIARRAAMKRWSRD